MPALKFPVPRNESTGDEDCVDMPQFTSIKALGYAGESYFADKPYALDPEIDALWSADSSYQ